MSGLDKRPPEKNNLPNIDRPLPPHIERVRQKMGLDVLGMWADIYKAAGAEEATVPSYRRFIREGYVPAAVRIFCEQYEERERKPGQNSQQVNTHELGEISDSPQSRPTPPKSFIMGKAAIIPPEAPDQRKKP